MLAKFCLKKLATLNSTFAHSLMQYAIYKRYDFMLHASKQRDSTKEERLVNYPNIEKNELPWLIGCVSEENIKDAEKFFERGCYKDVVIHKIIPWKRNCQPSCAWRVFYKLKDRTPNLVKEGQPMEEFIIPLPEDDEELKKLFYYIIVMVFGMNTVQKGYTSDRSYAIVDYVPFGCLCPGKVYQYQVATRDRSPIRKALASFGMDHVMFEGEKPLPSLTPHPHLKEYFSSHSNQIIHTNG